MILIYKYNIQELILGDEGVGVSCNGANDGQIEILISGGVGEYDLIWTFINSSGDIEPSFIPELTTESTDDNSIIYFADNLFAGEYTID